MLASLGHWIEEQHARDACAANAHAPTKDEHEDVKKQTTALTSSTSSSSREKKAADGPRLNGPMLQQSRPFLYRNLCESPMTRYADNHYLAQLLAWCADRGAFIHPAVVIAHQRSAYRDFSFHVSCDLPRHTPLLAIPEELVIGFKEDGDAADRNALFDAQKESAFYRSNHGSENKTGVPTTSSGAGGSSSSGARSEDPAPASESDVCDFFFYCLGSIVADFVTAVSSPLTDHRHAFAKSVARIRTLQNAPYLPDNTVFRPQAAKSSIAPEVGADGGAEDCSLADILFQMIRNYVNGGPLSGKVAREELLSTVSVCLSHSTPLAIGPRRSIGIVPLVHLMPHGGTNTNAVVVARPDDDTGIHRRLSPADPPAAIRMAEYFTTKTGYDFVGHVNKQKTKEDNGHISSAASSSSKKVSKNTSGFVYVVSLRDMKKGESVEVQAMAPVCTTTAREEEDAAFMWRLSAGTAPPHYLSSAAIAEMTRLTIAEIMAWKPDAK